MTTTKKKKASAASRARKPAVSRGVGQAKKDPKDSAKRESAQKASTRKEINPNSLDQEKARERLSAIYKLEKRVEQTKAVLDAASKARRAAKANHEGACEKLEREIREQRFGPGPLFNADGTGPAGAPAGTPDISEEIE